MSGHINVFYATNICMSSKTSLKRHMRIHLGVKSEYCVHCKKSFIDKSDLSKHIKIHTGIKNNKCNLCDKTFLTPKLLSLHQSIHTEKNPFGCNLCEKVFSSAKLVKGHLSHLHKINKHTGTSPFNCSQCGRNFNHKQGLVQHEKRHFDTNRNQKCQSCEKSFFRRDELRNHSLKQHNILA